MNTRHARDREDGGGVDPDIRPCKMYCFAVNVNNIDYSLIFYLKICEAKSIIFC